MKAFAMIQRFAFIIIWMFILTFAGHSQEINGHRTINVTFDTNSPYQLEINRGRLVWVDTDINTSTLNLKYYSGAEIVKLDSGLQSTRAAIDGDYVVWNTSGGQVKSYNLRTWNTMAVGSSYAPGGVPQPISVANGFTAYARNASPTGTEIVLRDLVNGTDSTLRASTWNTSPSIHHGQVSWVSGQLEATSTPTDIFFCDGITTRNISNVAGAYRCDNPILQDGQITWVESSLGSRRIRVFDGDTTVVLLEVAAAGQVKISGYDISDGITVASRTDTVANLSTIFIYRSDTRTITSLQDSNRISSLHIDNGMITWASGSGFMKVLTIHEIQGGTTETLGATDNPVLDDQQIAWTFGDAVEMRVPVTYELLTSDGQNGWSQTRFKEIDNDVILWGNFEQSQNGRLFFSNGSQSVRLTDSILYKDFVMVNDGYAIWREDFNNLWLFDGSGSPVKVVDSLQCENMYVAGGSIGFHGFRLSTGNNVNQAWLYRIATSTLTQLTNDVSQTVLNGITLADGNTACWYRFDGSEDMIMYYNGTTSTRLSDSTIDNAFSYRGGEIVWSERRNGIYQVMMYNVGSGTKTQITNGVMDARSPITDGVVIAWYEGASTGSYLCYQVIGTGSKTKITHLTTQAGRWLWLSNGRIAWSQDDEVHVFDGSTTSRLTNAGSIRPSVEPYVDNERVLWKNQSAITPQYGDIYRGKLRTLVAFEAINIVGLAPLNVTLLNRSWQGAQSYLWDFGDGMTSTEENPVHTYVNPGVYSVTLTATGPTGSVAEQKVHLVRVLSSTHTHGSEPDRPYSFSVTQNFPNPFNPKTTVEFSISHPALVKIRVFDILGREVVTLLNEEKNPGSHHVHWDATRVASGIYLYRFEAFSRDHQLTDTKKMIVVK